MSSAREFVEELQQYVAGKLASLDLLKAEDPGTADRSEVVRRLKVALKNEMEAAELMVQNIEPLLSQSGVSKETEFEYLRQLATKQSAPSCCWARLAHRTSPRKPGPLAAKAG